jgi:hypothetical protein
MVEKWVVTFGFNKENPRNFLAPSNQQSWNQPTKDAPPKTKGGKLNSNSGSTSYLVEQGGEDKCWRCDWPHKKKHCPKSPHATILNFSPN